MLRVRPAADRHILRWYAQASSVPDRRLRRIALAKIGGEAQNSRSAAFLAIVAGRDWSPALRRIVAFQTLYELLDGLNEQQPGVDEGLSMHRALTDAVGSHSSQRRGYVGALVSACRRDAPVSEPLVQAARRVSEAQAHNHALSGPRQWAEQRSREPWWEAAAAGISSLDVLAMLASEPAHHAAIADAYEEICVLSALLDGLVDQRSDGLDNHNWCRHYVSTDALVERIVELARSTDGSLSELPNGSVHSLMLAGLLAHNIALGVDRSVGRQLADAVPRVRLGVEILRRAQPRFTS